MGFNGNTTWKFQMEKNYFQSKPNNLMEHMAPKYDNSKCSL